MVLCSLLGLYIELGLPIALIFHSLLPDGTPTVMNRLVVLLLLTLPSIIFASYNIVLIVADDLDSELDGMVRTFLSIHFF